jgi:hypothetical protein
MFTEPDDWDEDDDELILDPWGEPEDVYSRIAHTQE